VKQECKDAQQNLDTAINEKRAKEQQTFMVRKAIHDKTAEALQLEGEILKLQIKLDKTEKSAKDAESDTTLKDEICALRLKLSEMKSDTETRFRELHDKCREVLNKSNEQLEGTSRACEVNGGLPSRH
jgi:hypothetical protein